MAGYPAELGAMGIHYLNPELLQITETIPPEVLFRDYVYFSSFSDTMLRSAKAIAQRLTRERGLGADALVVEINNRYGVIVAVPSANHVRVDIDEHDVPRFQANAPASGKVRGESHREYQLRFVHIRRIDNAKLVGHFHCHVDLALNIRVTSDKSLFFQYLNQRF